jgi:farnesyl-diphosphate farnesyltransferase
MSTQIPSFSSIASTTAFQLTDAEQTFLSDSLTGVSRSFALVIPVLEAPLDSTISLAYLVCRVCDNIEDCEQPLEWKRKRFDEFDSLVENPEVYEATLARWSEMEWPGLTEEEQRLMGPEGSTLWAVLSRLPVRLQHSVLGCAHEMQKGMLRSLEAHPEDVRVEEGVQTLLDDEALERYCYYVAGTVGWMCTEMAVYHYNLHPEVRHHLHLLCEQFGAGLQKTNILKDFARDRKRGFSYFPLAWHEEIDNAALRLEGAPTFWKRQVLENILSDLSDALDYVVALPLHAQGYRLFCLRAIIPAYETLLIAAKNSPQLFTPEHHVKISRGTLWDCLKESELQVADNERIHSYRSSMESQILAELSAH